MRWKVWWPLREQLLLKIKDLVKSLVGCIIILNKRMKKKSLRMYLLIEIKSNNNMNNRIILKQLMYTIQYMIQQTVLWVVKKNKNNLRMKREKLIILWTTEI